MLKKQYSKSKPVCKVTFTLPKDAIEAKEVVVLGEFNNWNQSEGIAMKAGKAEFKAVVELSAGKNYQFRYLADGKTWLNDWAADDYIATPYGVDNSVVFVDEVLDVTPKAKKTVAKKAVAKTTTKPVAKKTTATKKTTTKKATAKKAVKDDLRKIEGIGPKIAGLLNEAGIVTFNDLAKANITVLKDVLKNAGPRFKMHTPDTWAEQAKLAAKGDWTTLKTLQEELKGGKRK